MQRLNFLFAVTHRYLACDLNFGLMEKQKLHPKYQLQVFAPDDWIQVNLPARKPHSLL